MSRCLWGLDVWRPRSSLILIFDSPPPTPKAMALRPTPPAPAAHRQRVAVIGAGAGGLIAARELRREGLGVVVFERENQVGGTWVYDPNSESDPLGLDPRREVVHSSLYASLRTNLPRECMGFGDFPFIPLRAAGRDPRRFPGHAEVLHYLEDFAREFRLYDLIRFETDVFSVVSTDYGAWKVGARRRNDGNEEGGIFDAVVVSSGHFTEPRIAQIPGIHAWPGKQMHSHNYRIPEPFCDQVVIIIGSSSSAADISSEVAEVAKEVHISSRSDGIMATGPCNCNVWFHSMIKSTCKDGAVFFEDGSVIAADAILHCTGYKYHFPFLDTNGAVTVDDNRVGPLYKHVFPPALAPGLSFIGLPWKVIPFPLVEMQSKWIAGILSGRVALPSEDAMMKDVESFYRELEASGIPKRYTHNIADYQNEYNDWLAAQCGCAPTEEWRKAMYVDSAKNRRDRPTTYRDEWDDEHSVAEAYRDFTRYTSHRHDKAP